MQAKPGNYFASLATILGGWELVLIVSLLLILFLAKRFPDLGRGFRQGIDQFWRACRKLTLLDRSPDEAASEAGKSIGGIYGKPAAEALTPENQTAELYDPNVFHKIPRTARRIWTRVLRWIQRFLRHIVRQKTR